MSAPTQDFRIVLCTAGSERQAADIARALVETRLAACVNVVGSICSTYRWQGKVIEEGESLLIIKTEASRFEALRVAVREMHSYDTPELIAFAVTDGDPDYLAWLGQSL